MTAKTAIAEIDQQQSLFDCQLLDAETRIVLQQRAGEIKTLAKRVASDIVEIGGKLAEVKQRLGGNGRFNAWLSAELGWSERTAYHFLAVHQKFESANFAIGNVAPSALYLLVAPNTPESARQAAIQMADEGEQVTHKVAKTLVRVAKEAEPKMREMFEESDDVEESEAELVQPDPVRSSDDDPNDRAGQPIIPANPYSKAESPKPPAKVSDALKFIQESEFQVNVRLMPADGDSRGRQAIVAIMANDGPPLITSKRLPDTGNLWPEPIGEALAAFIEAESQKAAKPKPVKKNKKLESGSARSLYITSEAVNGV